MLYVYSPMYIIHTYIAESYGYSLARSFSRPVATRSRAAGYGPAHHLVYLDSLDYR